MSEKSVMVVGGAGIVGTNAVGYITHTPGIERVIIADMNESRGAMLANGNTLSTALLGLYPKVEFQKMDLSNEDAVVSILEKKKPKAT
jgi:saccharopine dehydrogenase-like NADP-dependent oxidoreductase